MMLIRLAPFNLTIFAHKKGYDKHTPGLRRLDGLVKKRDMKASSTRRPMTDEEFEEARQIAIAQFDSEDFFEQDSFLRSAEHLKVNSSRCVLFQHQYHV